jgi:hypothetical protein
MHTDTDIDDFLQKWRTAWPEWRIAQVFVAERERAVAEAWFALLQECSDAAWSGDDPTPGFAKLGWWQDELHGWGRGGRRHPLGRVLQKIDAPWVALSAALTALRDSREALRAQAMPDDVLSRLQPLSAAIAACEAALFAHAAGAARQPAAGHALLAQHALWHAPPPGSVQHAEAAVAQAFVRRVLETWPITVGPRPRRVYEALLRRRLRGVGDGGPAAALSPLPALLLSWRAARG